MRQLDVQKCYEIICHKDVAYAGLFFVGVTSTGIFCRPGCPAPTPKVQHCRFFHKAQEALAAGFRACKRCQPLAMPDATSALIRRLLAVVDLEPERVWREADLQRFGIDSSTARRQFQKRFNMSFIQYARTQRLKAAQQVLAQGEHVISAQLTAGYESASGFRHAFSERFGRSPHFLNTSPLYIEWLDTPLGTMIAICDVHGLFLLEFTRRKNLEKQVERLIRQYGRPIIPGRTEITEQIAAEMATYFETGLRDFTTPLVITGTPFQKQVWGALRKIAYGQTSSYANLAKAVGKEKAVRAVGSANGSNAHAIVIPCHRVINMDGKLGGYAGGLKCKAWLLEHERQTAACFGV